MCYLISFIIFNKDFFRCVYQIGSVDKKETEKQLITLKRKEVEKIRVDINNKKISLDKEDELGRKQEVSEFFNEIPDEAENDTNNEDD